MIENNVDTTIDFLLTHEAEKRQSAEYKAPPAKSSPSKEETKDAKEKESEKKEEKVDLDMLLALELQQEEMEAAQKVSKEKPKG